MIPREQPTEEDEVERGVVPRCSSSLINSQEFLCVAKSQRLHLQHSVQSSLSRGFSLNQSGPRLVRSRSNNPERKRGPVVLACSGFPPSGQGVVNSCIM